MIIIIILIILILVCSFSSKENYGQFPTMSYVYKKNYLECCKKFGCQHWSCSDILRNDLSRKPLLRVGYLQLFENNVPNTVPYYRARMSKDTTNVLELYKMPNSLNLKVDDYYYSQPMGKYYSKYVKLHNDHNYKEDEVIEINNLRYLVKYLGENEYAKSFVPLWPEIIRSYPHSSITPVNWNYPMKIGEHQYIGRLINKWHFNGKPLGRWFEAKYYLYGLPLEDGLKYKYIIIQRYNNSYRTLWTFVRNRYSIGDHIHLKKANRFYGPLFLVA